MTVQMLITYKCKVAHTDAKCGAISFYDRLQIVHLQRKFREIFTSDRMLQILHATDHEDSNENDNGRG